MNLQKLNPLSLFFLLIIVFITSKSTQADDGPVYVNPNDPVQLVQPTKIGSGNAINYMTQTVYGFLDFTTTIGNTVMVFSPQSAPPPELPKTTPKPPAPPIVNTIIETKPPSTEKNFIVNEIKPSKTITKTTVQQKPAKSLSSVVHVVANTPKKSAPKSSKVQLVSSHVEIHADTVTKHNNPNIPSSQKNIKANNKSKSPIVIASHVEVKTEPKPTITVQSQANPQIIAADNNPIIYSSVVEVHSSDNENHSDDQQNENDDSAQPILQIENDLAEPEYDFLSRQPSEFAEETFLVHDIKPSNSKPIQKSRVPNEPKKTSNNNNNNNNNRNKGNSNNNNNSNKSASNKRNDVHPTGLVTKLGGTVVKDGRTTVHETSVIGTYISGKYAQVLQSTSHIFNNNAPANKPKITPSQSLRILKTAAPHNPKNQQHQQQQQQQTHHFQPQQHQTTTPKYLNHETVQLPVEHELYGNSPSPNLVRSSRRPASAQSSFKNRFRNRNSKDDNDLQDIYEPVHPVTSPTTFGNGGKKGGKNKHKTNRYNRFSTSSVELATVSVLSETATPAYVSRRTNKGSRNGFKPSNAFTPDNSNNNNNNNNNNNGNAYTRRFKPKLQPTPVALIDSEQQTSSLYKFKLNRAPGRWQYKTSPKPKVTIRKQNGESADQEQPTQASPIYDNTSPLGPISNDINARSDDVDLDSSGSVHGDVLNHDVNTLDNVIESKRLPVETLNVEISTPVDFRDTYYEIATIKTPYTFQVGSVKNTRYITVTSTFEKTLDPEPTVTAILNEPLTENILATTAHIDKEHNLLDSSIATLPPILLSSDVETPPLETLTETFSTTQVMLKTHILPVLREGHNATSYTLTQTYHITRLVTATKTLPPMDAYQFNPSKALKEFNSKLDEAGSELNLELEFGDDNREDGDDDDDDDNNNGGGVRIALPDDLDLSNIGSDFKLSEVDKSNIPEAHLRPKKKHSQKQHQLQLTTPIPSVMPNLSPEQLQQLAILQYLNPAAAAQLQQQAAGIAGLQSSRPVIKLETIYESHVIPIFNGQSTSFSTISRPVATISKTEYEIVNTAIPQIQQIPQFAPPQINPLFQQPQQQQQQLQITTAPIITQTMLTQTSSKVLKLTFGAKTAYTTIFSTTVVPTLLTTYITQSVQVQPTAAFPGFYPPPYAPYPYVG